MNFGDMEAAKAFMVVVKKRIRQEVDTLRPEPRIATVNSISYETNLATVLYPEDNPDSAGTPVGMYDVVPWRTGQSVRVGGRPGDRHIIEVLGPRADSPPGIIQAWAGPIPGQPAGWLNCDGSAFDPVVYAELFLAIGITFGGTVDAPLLPNLQGQFLRGGNPGVSGGAASHAHNLSDAGGAKFSMSATQVWSRIVAGFASWGITNVTGTSSTTGGATSTSGAGLQGSTDSTSTVPPYVAVNWIIKC